MHKKIRFFSHKPLAFQLNLILLPIAAAILIFTLFYKISFIKKTILESAQNNAESITITAANYISGVLEPAERLPQNVALSLDSGFFAEMDFDEIVTGMLKTNQDIFGAAIALKPDKYSSGEAVYAYRSDSGIRIKDLHTKEYRYTEKEWFLRPINMDSSYWTQPYFDEGGGDVMMISYSVPFRAGDNKPAGVVTVDIDLKWLDSFVKNLQIIEDGYVFLIDQSGRMLAGPRNIESLPPSILHDKEILDRLPELAKIGRRMIKGEIGFEEIHADSINQDLHVYFAPLKSVGWSLGVIYPENQLYEGISTMNYSLAIIGLVAILMLFFLIILVSRKITRPITSLALAIRNIGYGNLDAGIPDIRTSRETRELSTAYIAMQNQLRSYISDLKSATAAKEKIESELKIAHGIQQNMIPKVFPPFPDRKELDVYAILNPAREVGGDLYDFFFVDDHQLCFAIGDVSGKGVPAALFMAITRTLLRAKATKGREVNEIVKQMNIELCRDNEDSMFVTFFLAILDLRTGKLAYCNAGHNYPWWLKKEGNVLLGPGQGLPLGIFADQEYELGHIQLQAMESLVLYTDGVPEAVNINNDFYSDERLAKLLENNKLAAQPDLICLEILEDTLAFAGEAERSDDITLLALSYFGSTETTENKK